jgi:hypothetical protein
MNCPATARRVRHGREGRVPGAIALVVVAEEFATKRGRAAEASVSPEVSASWIWIDSLFGFGHEAPLPRVGANKVVRIMEIAISWR